MSRFLHSHSADDEKFGHCRAAYLLYQQGAPKGKEPDNYAFGRTAHLVMQFYVDHCIERGRRSDITVIPDLVDKAVRQTGMPWRYFDELRTVAEAFLRVYEIDVEHSISREGGIAFDDEFNVIDWSDAIEYDTMTSPAEQHGDIFFRLKLDHSLLYPDQDLLVIQDYKFDFYAPSQSSIEKPESRFQKQATKYSWGAWRAQYQATVVRVDFVFARHIFHGKPLVRSLSFTKDRILETQDLVAAECKHIEDTVDFPAMPGDHCIACAYRDTACPIRQQRDDAAPEFTVEAATETMRMFIYQQVLQTERRTRLKEFVAEFGYEGQLGPLKAVFEAVEGRVADMKRVWETLLAYGVDNPWAVMKLSDTDAKRIFDKDVYADLTAAAYDSAPKTVFNVHQNKDVLQALCEQRGIPTQKPGKDKMKDRTVAELAWDLANSVKGSADDVLGSFETPATDVDPVVDTSLIEELN